MVAARFCVRIMGCLFGASEPLISKGTMFGPVEKGKSVLVNLLLYLQWEVEQSFRGSCGREGLRWDDIPFHTERLKSASVCRMLLVTEAALSGYSCDKNSVPKFCDGLESTKKCGCPSSNQLQPCYPYDLRAFLGGLDP